MLNNSIQNEVIILIPVYRPDTKLKQLIHALRLVSQDPIVLVDDGNQDLDSQLIFEALAQVSKLQIVSHPMNLGKGAALKTGFQYILDHHPSVLGCVTADADGQHTCQDIMAVLQQLSHSQGQNLVLGVRDFSNLQKNIPLRSWLGNRITSGLFKLATGLECQDTQTGLRGIPIGELPHLLWVNGQKFDFEMNQLLDSSRRMKRFDLVQIQTVYIEKNQSSHFHPLVDSLKVMKPMFRFLGSSCLSTLVDLSFFRIFSSNRSSS